MNYKLKYEEVLERAKQLLRTSETCDRFTIERLFPELKESDDERIRKEIICHINNMKLTTISDLKEKQFELWIAWLEKQNIFSKKDIDDAYLEGVRDTKNEIEKQYEASYQIRKDIATFIFNYEGDIKDRAKWMNYLGIKVSVKEQGEQKPTDKVEPKFHKGDWVVDKSGFVQQVLDFRGETYTCTYNSFTTDCESNYHLWTIQDAKDGNVLASDNGVIILVKESRNSSWGYRLSYHCAILYDGTFEPKEFYVNHEKFFPASKEQRDVLFQKMKEAGYEWDAEKKELKRLIDEKQIKKNLQDNSFRRMFEQKSEWSGDDNEHVKSIIERLEGMCKKGATFTTTRFAVNQDIDWLNSLKQRLG